MSPKHMARWTWTDTPPGGAQLGGTLLRGIAVHWPGSETDAYGVENAGQVRDRIEAWRDYHVNDNGWSDIGYNYAIDQAGRVWELRGLDRVGAHAASDSNPNANHEWFGVLLILGAEEDPTPAMLDAFRWFRTGRFLNRWPGRLDVIGHTTVSGASTECPGRRVLDLLAAGRLTTPPQDQEEEDMPTVDDFIDGLTAALQPDTGDTDFRQALALFMQNVVFADPDVRQAIRDSVMNAPILNRVDDKNYPLSVAVSSGWWYEFLAGVAAANNGDVPERFQSSARAAIGPPA